MNWFLWFLVAFFLARAIIRITQIGKERPKLTPGDAAFIALLDAAVIAGIFVFGAHR